MKVDLLVDADVMSYACGYLAETRYHVLGWTDVVPGKPDRARVATFREAWRRDEFIRLMNLHPNEYDSVVDVIPGPFGFARQAVMTTLEGIVRNAGEFLAFYGHETGDIRLFLTGGRNFRMDVATIRPYKGNRTQPKPYHWKALRSWMIHELGAELTDGVEADDAMAMVQYAALRDGGDPDSASTMICTIDKDLDMVPGFHYNFHNKDAYWQTPADGRRWFYRQLLTGDVVDNIPGCKGIGPAKAAKMISEDMSEIEQFQEVLGQYCINIDAYPEHHAPHKRAYDSLMENARLLWMMRYEGDVWTPPV